MIKPNSLAMKTLLAIFAFTITNISSKYPFASSIPSNHVPEIFERRLRTQNEFRLRATRRRNLSTVTYTTTSTISSTLENSLGKDEMRRAQEESESEVATETTSTEEETVVEEEEEADDEKSPLEQVTDTIDTVRDKANETFKSDPRSWDATNWGIAGGILVFAFIVVSCVLKRCCCKGK